MPTFSVMEIDEIKNVCVWLRVSQRYFLRTELGRFRVFCIINTILASTFS